ncbi:VOC family protein [Ramlibacter sp. PS4R-6]|uniref:VOC family protein n=1 Tax=Ramlibacter sp. PS4R-6 TaxID=3133438 RepID=UPI0030AC0F4E
MQAQLDHLVVAARSLAEGIAWCREMLGFEPVAGGEHPLMGTHNRVFALGGTAYPRAYFEIIAIDPAAPRPAHARWFDLDTEAMHAALARRPRLVHFVAASNDAAGAVAALAEFGIERGPLVAAERNTPAGLLRWKISVRHDGARLFDGALPTLIQWDSPHPADSLPASGIALASLAATHPDAARLRQAFGAIGLRHVAVQEGPANLVAELDTPRGRVRLESQGA